MRSSVTNNSTALVPYAPVKASMDLQKAATYNNDNAVIDMSHSIYYALPDTAKQYYLESTEKDFKEWTEPLGPQKSWYLSYLRCFASHKTTYLNSNELLCAIIDGQHKVFRGPGLFYLANYADRIIRTYTIGQDIDFGPIKVVYVKAGTLRYATKRNTGQPMLLGPGLHYFNDLNFQASSKEIIMNFKGENTQVFIDDIQTMSFVYVKEGYEGLIVDRSGAFKSLVSGLHFLQSPASFKTFISITDASNSGMFSLLTSVSTTLVPTELDMKRRAMINANEIQDTNMYNLLVLKENSSVDVSALLLDVGVTNGNLLRVLIQNQTDQKCKAVVIKVQDSLKLVPRIMFETYLNSFQ